VESATISFTRALHFPGAEGKKFIEMNESMETTIFCCVFFSGTINHHNKSYFSIFSFSCNCFLSYQEEKRSSKEKKSRMSFIFVSEKYQSLYSLSLPLERVSDEHAEQLISWIFLFSSLSNQYFLVESLVTQSIIIIKSAEALWKNLDGGKNDHYCTIM
jgi:hypothetical protein